MSKIRQNDIPTQPNILDELKLDKAVKLAKENRTVSKRMLKNISRYWKNFPETKALDGIKTLASENLAIKSDMQPVAVAKPIGPIHARSAKKGFNRGFTALKNFLTRSLYTISLV